MRRLPAGAPITLASRAAWRADRLGLGIATWSGGMRSAEAYFAAEHPSAELARATTAFAPFDAALARFGLDACPLRTQILAACAASTIAIGTGVRWLERGACDLVLAG